MTATAWRVLRDGPAPLLDADPAAAERTPLHVAVVLPSLPVGSGGHNVVFQVVLGLEALGHTCSIWVLDGPPKLEWPAALRRKVLENYGPVAAPVFRGLGDWYGADVALATSWETAYAVAALPGCRARAYLLNDHEPEFHPTSVERELAERSYGLGLHGIAASPWLAALYASYGGSTSPFAYGVDHTVYRPGAGAGPRRRDTIVFYGRAATPRRAVPLGAAALERLVERRPGLRVVVFGDREPPAFGFPAEHAGVATPTELARLFGEGTVGLCLSLTNYSLVPQEMLACGLPCVDLDRPSTRSVYGDAGAVALAPFDPGAIAKEVERLLEDEAEWERRSRAGRALVAGRTWAAAAGQVEAGLRAALRR